MNSNFWRYSRYANINNLQLSDRNFITNRQFGMIKMDKILGKCKIPNRFIFSICCRYTLELPLYGNSNVYLQHMSFQ